MGESNIFISCTGSANLGTKIHVLMIFGGPGVQGFAFLVSYLFLNCFW